ncbi:MAG: hypothetical protein ACYTF5_21485, partial [Planctomycetota bacterium]
RLLEAGFKGAAAGGAMAGGGRAAKGGVEMLQGAASNTRENLRERLAEGLDAEDVDGAGPTAPEPPATLQAGVDAIGRGGRIAAYSADPKGFDELTLPAGAVVVRSQDGGAYVTDQMHAHRVQTLDKAGKQAEILGYPNEKPADPENTVVAQAKDAQGRTVQDVATTPEQLDLALEQGNEAAGPGGSVDVKTLTDALIGRQNDYNPDDEVSAGGARLQDAFAEAGYDASSTADPDALVGALTDAAVQQEAQTLTVKNTATARLMKKIYGGKSTRNTDGSTNLELAPQDPKATQGDPAATHPLVVRALSKVFDDGQSEQRGRILALNPHPTQKNAEAGRVTHTKINLPAVMRLGRQLNQLNESATDSQMNNLLSGLSHLYALGFIPKKIEVQQDGKTVTRALDPRQNGNLLPDNAIIDGRAENGTAVTFGDLRREGKRKGKLTDNLNALQDSERSLEDTQSEVSGELSRLRKQMRRYQTFLKNRFKPKADGQLSLNFGPEEVQTVKDELEQIYSQLRDLRDDDTSAGIALAKVRKAFNALKEKARSLGIETRDGQGDNREIEQEQEATVIRAKSHVVTLGNKTADKIAARNEKKVQVSKGEIDQILSEHVEDTRKLETDATQAARSARDTVPRASKKAKAAKHILAHRNNKVSQISGKLNNTLVDMAGAVLKLLGLKNQLVIVDELGAVAIIRKLKAQRKEETDARRAAAMDYKI